MTPLAQAALDFCRECMRWEDPRPHNFMQAIAKDGTPTAWLSYTNLDSVVSAVQKWCLGNRFQLEINTTTLWNVHICFGGKSVGFGSYTDFAHALLAACVDASRKLKADDRTSSAGSVSVPQPNR